MRDQIHQKESRVKKIPISEIFGPTIQGEGIQIGKRAIFIRVAGCDTQCPWCDTKYAWERARSLSEDEILDEVGELSQGEDLVILTGGNPALYDLGNLVRRLNNRGYRINVETQGTRFQEWMRNLFVTVSPKPHDYHPDIVQKICDATITQLKVVVFDEEDYIFAKRVYNEFYHLSVAFIFQGGHPKKHPDSWLAEKVAADKELRANCRVLPQWHRIIWGDRKGV